MVGERKERETEKEKEKQNKGLIDRWIKNMIQKMKKQENVDGEKGRVEQKKTLKRLRWEIEREIMRLDEVNRRHYLIMCTKEEKERKAEPDS